MHTINKYRHNSERHTTPQYPQNSTELDDFFNLSLDLLCIADTDGYFHKVNQKWESTLGYRVDELEGRLFLDFVHPDDQKSTVQAIATLEAQQPIHSFINRYQHKDGSYRVLEWRSQPRGKMIYAVARDITEQHHVEDALRQSELRYRSVVTTMSEGIVLQTQDGIIRTCNPAAECILGLTADQMMGRTSIDPRWRAVHGDGTPFPGETHPAMVTLRTGQPQSNIVMGVHKPNGNLTWILINTQPIFEEDTSQPVAVVASFTDITILKEITEALQESEERFRIISGLITNYAYGITVDVYQEFELDWIVGAFKEITGYQLDELGKRGGWSSIIHPEDSAIAQARRKRILAGEESVDEFRIIAANGSICWVRDYSKPIWDEKEGRTTYIYGAVQNITIRKKAEQQAQELVSERERVELLADFITNTSHELRTPLAIINTSLHLLMRSQDPEKRQEKANQINDQVHYLDTLINQLHEVLRLDRLSEIELSLQAISTLLKVFETNYHPQNPTITITITVEANLPKVRANPIYVQTALTHLVENAVNFSPDNSIVEITAYRVGSDVCVDVKDTGKGIEQAQLDLIFDLFYKADSARTQKQQGAGIGLTMVKRIMQLHHGHVTVQSEVGSGTIFTLRFPLI